VDMTEEMELIYIYNEWALGLWRK